MMHIGNITLTHCALVMKRMVLLDYYNIIYFDIVID